MQINAKKGIGVDDLLETVALVAEVEQLTATLTRLQQITELAARPSHVKQVICGADQRQERHRRG